MVIPPNEMLLCDGAGCGRRPTALPAAAARGVPGGEWLCPVCDRRRRRGPEDEHGLELQVGTSLWAKDKRGLWGEAIVQTAEEAGGEVARVGLRWKGFAASTTIVDVGGGRLRPLARGPPAREGARRRRRRPSSASKVLHVRLRQPPEYLTSWQGRAADVGAGAQLRRRRREAQLQAFIAATRARRSRRRRSRATTAPRRRPPSRSTQRTRRGGGSGGGGREAWRRAHAAEQRQREAEDSAGDGDGDGDGGNDADEGAASRAAP